MHIGEEIRERVRISPIDVSTFAKKINRSRQAVYGIFRRPTIDTGLLYKISKVLDYDFFSVYVARNEWSEPQLPYRKELDDLRVESAQEKKENAMLREQVELLTKMNTLLEEKMAAMQKK